jgi:hypothetical protein
MSAVGGTRAMSAVGGTGSAALRRPVASEQSLSVRPLTRPEDVDQSIVHVLGPGGHGFDVSQCAKVGLFCSSAGSGNDRSVPYGPVRSEPIPTG